MAAAKPPPDGQLLTYGLFSVFGVSAWVTVNGIFAQLPLLAARQPEGAPSLTPTLQGLSLCAPCCWGCRGRVPQRCLRSPRCCYCCIRRVGDWVAARAGRPARQHRPGAVYCPPALLPQQRPDRQRHGLLHLGLLNPQHARAVGVLGANGGVVRGGALVGGAAVHVPVRVVRLHFLRGL